MISKSGVHLPDTTYGGNPIAWKNADDSDEELRRIRAENANLREYIERKRYLQDFARLVDENSKLRKLVEDMLDCIEIRAAWHRPPTEEMCEEFAQRARELRIEVEE